MINLLLKGGQNLKVLGIGLSPVEDLLKFEAELNFSPKRKSVRRGSAVTA